MISTKWGRLTVVNFVGVRGSHKYFKCSCECGEKVIVRGAHLRSGDVLSCGCYSREKASQRLTLYATSDKHRGKGNPAFKHGATQNPLYKIWAGIKARCNTESAGNYSLYGGKNIRCTWKTYESFKRDMGKTYLAHVKKYGARNTTIDRLNPKRDYSKRNCRWASWSVQAFNRWKWNKIYARERQPSGGVDA